MKRVSLGDVLELRRSPITIEPDREYVSIGVRSFGKGVFHYEPVSGSDLSKLRYFSVRPNELIISNIKAWEGAVAVTQSDDEGCVASNRFLTYVSRDDQVHLNYLRYFLLSEQGLPLLQAASPGSADRNRTLAIDRFESLTIPLPSPPVQRRIAARIEELLDTTSDIGHRVSRDGATNAPLLYAMLVERVLERSATERAALGELVDFVSDIVRPGDDAGSADRFVGLQHIESHTGEKLGELPGGDEKGRKFRFQPGDVLYGYLRPYLNKVWLADSHGLCSVEQYVLRTRGDIPASYLAHALRSRSVLNEAIRLTHNLQLPRLRSGLLAAIEIPVVPPESVDEVVGELDSQRSKVIDLVRAYRTRETRVAALRPAILNAAFSGQL